MKQWTSKEFIKMIKKNGFSYSRSKGDHAIFVNDEGRHISVPETLKACIARRLIKENNLNYDTKRKGTCFMCIVCNSDMHIRIEVL